MMADDVLAEPIRPLRLAPIPIRDVGAVVARLPEPLTSFVNRDHELLAVAAMLRRDDTRLVTLSGPGGVGKSRIALAVAREISGEFRDGVAFVALAAVREPALVPVRIAQALSIREDGQPAIARLQSALRDQHLLLFLDNFERALDAAPMLTELLADCPLLKILVTSRARLNVSGEHAVAVTPLDAPDLSDASEPDTLLESAAVRLFVERTHAVDPEFRLSAANGETVAAICRRLEGLPLAIELAAARSASLSPAALLAGLATRLQVLSGGPRDAPARLRTMRDAIAWSDDLLSDDERMAFRRLAVFAGGFTLDAMAAVAVDHEPPDPLAVVDLVGSLIDKSLVHRLASPAGGPLRFGMLETIREYAQERLEESDEAEEMRRRHAEYYLTLGEAAEARRIDLTATARLPLGAERDNFRAALFSLATDGETERMLRLAGALWPLWLEQGGIGHGRTQLADYLAQPDVRAHRRAWAKAASTAGALAQAQGDRVEAQTLSQEALAIAQEIGDDRCAGMAATTLGLVAMVDGDLDQAASFLEAGLASFHVAADARIVWTLRHLGSVAFFQRDLPLAIQVAEEGLRMARPAGNGLDTARLLLTLSHSIALQGQIERAVDHLREAVVLFEDAGDSWGVADALVSIGEAAYERGDLDEAEVSFAQGLERFRDIGDPEGMAVALVGIGWLARARGEAAEAAEAFRAVLALFGDRSPRPQSIRALLGLGAVALDRGDLEGAAERWGDALRHAQSRGDALLLATVLERLAHLAAAAERRPLPARLLAAGAALRAQIGAPTPPVEAREHSRLTSALSASPEEAKIASADDAARPLAVAGATAAMLDEAAAVAAAIIGPAEEFADLATERLLSTRERDVLRLLTEGRTDREIAEALSLSYRTVTTHVTAILTKLDVDSRTAAAVFAVRNGLA